jgi:hypothetical protein
LPQTGYFVSRGRDGSHLIFDAGPHGFLNGGHAHTDALSVVLTVEGEPLLVDPGTGSYIGNSTIRDRMRSARMHNTVVLDGRHPAIPRGPFHWETRADARLLTTQITDRWDFAVGTHDAYQPHRHVRAVLALHGSGWLIVDRVVGGRVEAEAWWHLHPSWRAEPTAAGVDLISTAGQHVALVTTATDVRIVDDPAFAAYAPEYGRIETSRALCAARTGREAFTIGTFIAVPTSHRCDARIVELPPQRHGKWVICPFAIASGTTELEMEVAFPLFDVSGQPPAAIWPQPCIRQLKQPCVE